MVEATRETKDDLCDIRPVRARCNQANQYSFSQSNIKSIRGRSEEGVTRGQMEAMATAAQSR
ncbi:hypothetical protein [Paludisphaera borealis]|uniref:Uncharacterized protein n=1 Tax=Paludisphaera borealis TaxID=1387353 RepID=A0A1U7CWH2_9BACT|nr:hypothetical protein [Paludisphaera borealis]APW63239.1 hypothetical protein BSF38_04803 [Paludisphaera borealis]